MNLPYSYSTLASKVSVSVVGDTQVMRITVTDESSEQALMIVSPLADIAPEASPLMNILIIKIMDIITEKTKREPTAVIKKMKKKTADIKKVGDKK